jgi:predicted permease
MKRFWSRLRDLLSSVRAERDLDREVTSHLECIEDEYRRRGMAPAEARLAARRAMGSVALAKDLHRDARSFVWIEDCRRDVRHAVRGLQRSPGFTAAVILTLALGIGANTAMFSVINAVLLRPLPYPDADRLVYLVEEVPAGDGGGSERRPAMDLQTFAEFRAHVRTLSDVSVQHSTTMTLATSRETVRLIGSRVTPSFFTLLGARPLLGRIFESGDEAAGNEVILLSYHAWERHFARASDIVGRPVTLDGRRYSIAGVMPREFRFYPNPLAEFWIPFVLRGSDAVMVPVVAKLKNGVSTEVALSEITGILDERRGAGETPTLSIVRVQDQIVAPARTALLVMAFAVGFVLLIACVNVANLILARTSAREREITIRRALGAGERRIATLFLAESLVLVTAGGTCAVAVAVAGVRLLRLLGTSLPRQDVTAGVSIPRLGEVAVDTSTLLFALAVSLLAGVMFGLTPIVGRHRFSATAALHGAPASAGVDVVRANRLRRALVVGEIGLAMTLLVAAALMTTSFARLLSVDPGYDPDGVVTFQATLPEGRDMAGFAEELIERLESVPGVRAAGYSIDGLMTGGSGKMPLRSTPGRERPAPGEPTADPVYVSHHYLAAMGIDVASGRGFLEADRLGSPQVMLVNRSLVRSRMLGPTPLGKRVYALFREPWEIVGIVEDIRPEALDEEPYPQFFIDLRQVPGFPFSEFRPYFAVRTDGDTAAILANLRGIVRRVESQASIDNVATVDQILWNSVSRPRLYTVLMALFATLAVALAAVGIFGLMAYLVEQRTKEIGIRMALGARRSDVMSGVLGQSAPLILMGVGSGLVAAAGLTRYLEGMLFGLTPLDPLVFGAAAMLFSVVALGASYLPAWRATRIDPLVALRAE